MAPRVELICVGTELLDGQVNTHEGYIGLKLRAMGLSLDRGATLRDDAEALAAAVRETLGRCDVLLICGGLGPTFDDITREAVSAALGRPLAFKPALWKDILKKFKRYRHPVPEENKRQAMVIEGAAVLANPFGSAPGQVITLRRPGRGPQTIALMPGPYAELAPMLEKLVLPRLRRAYAFGLFSEHACVRLAGLGESWADEKLAPLTARPAAGLRFTILAGKGQVDFHICAAGASRAQARRRLAKARREVYAAVGKHAFGEDDATLESAVGDALLKRGWTLAVAESCTGGLIGRRLTSVAGSSRYFRGGVIAYDNSLKTGLLGVSALTLEKHGAVSAECAREMARGARRACGASLGLSVTGVAGPQGGSRDKPVGLVVLALAGPGKAQCRHWRLHLAGGRETIRERAAAAALNLVLRRLR